ncbi:protein of unknown function [Pararobbsia alpina]
MNAVADATNRNARKVACAHFAFYREVEDRQLSNVRRHLKPTETSPQHFGTCRVPRGLECKKTERAFLSEARTRFQPRDSGRHGEVGAFRPP